MRVLICTHHFHEWAGSEVVVVELFEDLRRRGLEVRLFAPFLRPSFAHQALGDWTAIIATPDKINLADFDLVLVFHQAASRFLHLQDPDLLVSKDRPVFAYFHLSPYEPFESPGLGAQKLFADLVYANSRETRAYLEEVGLRDVALFENPAPKSFCATSKPSEKLTRLLSVSSHPPAELSAAFDILQRRGVGIYRVGKTTNFRRLRGYDLSDHDAIVTIGKSAQYGFRSGRPVFCYDHFQGPGWLGENQKYSSFAASARVNFSGRDHPMMRSPAQLADEIEQGYAQARRHALTLGAALPDAYQLDSQVDQLLDHAARLRSDRLGLLAQPDDIRADLLCESKVYELVDRAYEQVSGVATRVVTRPLLPASDNHPIESKHLRAPGPNEPMIIAAFSFRHDAHLVDGLIQNITPSVHGYVCWDDRDADRDDMFSDETTRQSALFEAARKMGADWIFAVDPDERFEDRLAEQIGPMTQEFGPVLWTFECREMFTPKQYRIDGLWGQRQRIRLFPCLPGMEPDDRTFHGSWTRNGLKLPQRQSGLNFYHLRMASPLRRRLRRDLYARLDATRANQALGYDYLDDERGKEVCAIPDMRAYSPQYSEDNGTWSSPKLQTTDSPAPPDPLRCQLKRLQQTWLKGGYENAMHVALDILKDHPDDTEMALWAADCALKCGFWDRALDLVQPIAARDPEALLARNIACRAQIELGQIKQARQTLSEIDKLAPDSTLFRALQDRLPARSLFGTMQRSTLWQRWIDGPATLAEGKKIANSEMSVVVLSLGAPKEVADAVASLLSQSEVPEITVVNSGGGDITSQLSQYRDRLRIISTPVRLYAGAARNVGIDASRGQYVGFLASDCTMCQGSIAARLHQHQNGARAVSAFVEPQTPDNLYQTAAAFLLHSSRSPKSVIFQDQTYSLSLDRSVFEAFGYYPTGLRIGEDTYLKHSLTGNVEIVSDPKIRLQHKYPNDKASLAQDIEKRALRRIHSLFFPYFDSAQTLRQVVNNAFEGRHDAVEKALAMRAHEFTDDVLKNVRETILEMLHLERAVSLQAGEAIVTARQLQQQALACLSEDRSQAEALILEALDLSKDSPGLARILADIRGRTAASPKLDHSIAQITQAARLDPGNADILLRLVELHLAAGDAQSARQSLELAGVLAPRRKEIWAQHAPLPGDQHRPMRVYCLQRMWFLDPFERATGQTIAENYRHAGNMNAHKARLRFAQALNGG